MEACSLRLTDLAGYPENREETCSETLVASYQATRVTSGNSVTFGKSDVTFVWKLRFIGGCIKTRVAFREQKINS
jgi:hypothetical protein